MATHKLPPWLRPKSRPHAVKVGVTWYTEDQWLLAKASASDPELFEPTYPEWVAMAELATKDMLAAGIVTERVLINASEFLAWCLAHGKENCAAARAEFVSHVQSRRNEGAA